MRVRTLAGVALALLFATATLSSAAPATNAVTTAPTGPITITAHLASVYGHHEALPIPDDLHGLDLVAALDALATRHDAPAPHATARAALAALDPQLADTLATLSVALIVAQDARNSAYQGIDDAELHAWLPRETGPGPDWLARVDTVQMQRASLTLAQAVDDAVPMLRQLVPTGMPSLSSGLPPALDLAPLLVVDPDGVDNLHTHDAVLVVDLGGDDTYDTNAGGALVHQGLVGDRDTCQLYASGIAVGCENEDSFAAFSASLLIDVAGDDTYGVHKAPRAGSRDAQCTTDPIIRRVVVQGSGSGGIGMLVDLAGHDTYHGKTLAQGNGHLGGVGALLDLAGDDTYTAIRSAMGSSVLGGTGVQYDGAGDDTYTFAAPTGGLFNVDQFRCDTTARLGLGTAVLAGTGHFQDVSGDDTYRIGSQGLGHAAAPDAAWFLDLAGNDDYGGYPGRGNGVTRPGAGVFVDAE